MSIRDRNPERFDRLPVWVRDEIYNLERIATEQHQRIRELSEGNPDSNTWVENHAHISDDVDVPLGINPTIRFEFNGKAGKPGEVVHAQLITRNGVEALEIQGYNSSVAVHPWSTNLIRITLGD